MPFSELTRLIHAVHAGHSGPELAERFSSILRRQNQVAANSDSGRRCWLTWCRPFTRPERVLVYEPEVGGILQWHLGRAFDSEKQGTQVADSLAEACFPDDLVVELPGSFQLEWLPFGPPS